MSHFTDLRRELENYLDTDTIENIHRAYHYAAQAHKGQQRHSGDPYITHPLAVADILAQMRMDPQTIMAAILHDVIEDTEITKEVLAGEFSEEVAELVDGVSKLAKVQERSRVEMQAENFRKMLMAMAKDIRVILIKLADRLHNMRTLGVLPPDKRRRIARETLEIYAPIANRLGMYAIRNEFEDLGFAGLHPMRYRILQEEVRKAKRIRRPMISQIESALKDCLEKHQIPPSVLWAKLKHLYSIYRDMHEKHISFSEIVDTYTFCIVVDSQDTCYRVLGAIHSLYKPLPQRFRDYIALPKANGYQALHTTLFGPYGVPIAIQIRTVEMDNIADNGIAAHWLINTPETGDHPAHVRAGEWLRRLLDIQTSSGSALEFIENVKIDLFPEEIYVFTPKGEILELPKGATPIDFAYAVHSDVGNTCTAARVDRRPVLLNTQLASGQTIEIICEPDAKPNPSWLNFVVTGKARSNIRHSLKTQQKSEAIHFGTQLLETALNHQNTHLKDLPQENITALLNQLHYKNTDELHEAIGLGNVLASQVAKRLTLNTDEHLEVAQENPIVITGTEGMLIHYAECCHPIPGDPIIGVLNKGHGITVHLQNCSNLDKLRNQPEKFVPVCWEKDIRGFFQTDIRLEAINEQGVLAQLASAIAAEHANIENISVEDRDGVYCAVKLTLSVRDRIHLARVIKKLRAIKSVNRISRGK